MMFIEVKHNKYRNEDGYLVKDMDTDEFESADEDVYESPDSLWISGANKELDDNTGLKRRIKVGSLGLPYTEYLISAEPLNVKLGVVAEKYLKGGNEYWEDGSDIDKLLSLGGTFEASYDEDGNAKCVGLFFGFEGLMYTPIGWVDEQYRGEDELAQHAVYEMVSGLLERDGIDTVATRVTSNLLDSWQEVAGEGSPVQFDEDTRIVWMGDAPPDDLRDWSDVSEWYLEKEYYGYSFRS